MKIATKDLLSYTLFTISNWILQLAETYGMDFFETSASTNRNISEVGQINCLSRCKCTQILQGTPCRLLLLLSVC